MLGRIAIDLSKDSIFDLRLDWGIKLAHEHEAELVGVYTHSLLAQYLYSGDTALLSQARGLLETMMEQQMAAAKESFVQKTQKAGVRASWRAPSGDAHALSDASCSPLACLYCSHIERKEQAASVCAVYSFLLCIFLMRFTRN